MAGGGVDNGVAHRRFVALDGFEAYAHFFVVRHPALSGAHGIGGGEIARLRRLGDHDEVFVHFQLAYAVGDGRKYLQRRVEREVGVVGGGRDGAFYIGMPYVGHVAYVNVVTVVAPDVLPLFIGVHDVDLVVRGLSAEFSFDNHAGIVVPCGRVVALEGKDGASRHGLEIGERRHFQLRVGRNGNGVFIENVPVGSFRARIECGDGSAVVIVNGERNV